MSTLEDGPKGLNFFTRVRERLGLSYRKFGRQVLGGVAPGSVSRLENGAHKTRIWWLLVSKEAAGMSDEEFVRALYEHVRSERP